MEHSGSSSEKCLFSQKKPFVIFQETGLSYISGQRNPEILITSAVIAVVNISNRSIQDLFDIDFPPV